ncbi:hypothetical protein JCM19235_1301 [Vibrio maritimus]|uniref:Uncharacterized protein n=1 Tax=Vibrio maritimus TaxID=990268 RepID=A0A090S5N7_9VIBR|nr:hypothetical protein JCM19235_1301 [Vibrio maritimus]
MVGRLIDWLYDDSKFQVTVLTQFFRAVGTPLYFIGYSFIAFGTYLQLHHMFEYPETWHEAYAIFALNATAILSICCGSLLIASDRHMAIKTDSKVISFYNLIEVTMKKGTKLICFWLALLAIVFLFFLVMAYFFPSTVLAKKVQSQEYIDSYNAMKTWITCVAHFYGISFFVMVECRFA